MAEMMAVLSSGSLFAGRFAIDGVAGSGGMGTVYRAIDRTTGLPVALKLLRNEGTEPNEASRFIREAQLLAELRHPRIVGYVAHGITASGQHFLAMEWLAGESLAQRLTRGSLPLPDALLLIERVAQGLLFAHQQGILHRDIKPSTVTTEGTRTSNDPQRFEVLAN